MMWVVAAPHPPHRAVVVLLNLLLLLLLLQLGTLSTVAVRVDATTTPLDHQHHSTTDATTRTCVETKDPNSSAEVCTANRSSSSTSASTSSDEIPPETTTTTTTTTFAQELQRAQQFRQFLRHMLDQLDQFYQANVGRATRVDLQYYALEQWLQYFGMDPRLVDPTQQQIPPPPLAQNWLETLYTKTKALAPTCLFTVWPLSDDNHANAIGGPTDEEMEVLLQMDPSPMRRFMRQARIDMDYMYDEDDTGELVVLNRHGLLQELVQPFRHRGHIARVLDTARRHILQSLELIAYAIPSRTNLELLARYAPLVEVGAGSGYWSATLQQWRQDVDIVAFDAVPPQPPQTTTTSHKKQPFYFDRNYTTIHAGTCRDIFDNHHNNRDNNNYANRTLLLIWPNNPDNVDNAVEFHSPALPPVWDYDCVQQYVAAGGTTVILVAEREVNLAPQPSFWQVESGLSATRQLQTYLLNQFELLEQQPVLSWYYRDDLTVWRRRPSNQTQEQVHQPLKQKERLL